MRYAKGGSTWIDLECPSEDELAQVLGEFGIDERVREEMTAPSPLPLAIAFPGYAYLVLHFPVADPTEGTRTQEVDFIVGKNFLITSRFEVIDALYTLHKVLEAENLIGTAPKRLGVDVLLTRMLGLLYRHVADDVNRVGLRLERIEKDVFSGNERRSVRPISEAMRSLLGFDTALMRHTDPLADFLGFMGAPAFFGTKFDQHAAHTEAERTHAASLVSSYREVAHELRQTNDSLLTSSQNRTVQVLTVFSFVSFPPLLIAAVFAMETELPIIHMPHDFWIVIGLMAATVVAFLAIARGNRWL